MMLFSLLAGSAFAGFTPEDCPFGVAAHQASTASLDKAADAGICWLRFDMNWWQFEPQRGVYDWTVADRFMADADARGMKVFVTIAYAPDWAVSGCDDNSPDEDVWCRNAAPDDVADWTNFVTAAVERYPQVQHWGMWNEPNLHHFFRGTRDEYVDELLVPGSAAVKAACPTCKVMGPELANLRDSSHWDVDAGTCVVGVCWNNGWEHSLRMILRDAGSSIDIITHHKYSDPADKMWGELVDGEFVVVQIMSGLKEITDQEAPGKPIWLTEFGWHTNPGGPHAPAYAAQELDDAYRIGWDVMNGQWAGTQQGAWPEMQKMFWYDLEDDPNTYSWGRATWGLLDEFGNAKPAWQAYADVIADIESSVPVGDDDDDDDDDTGDDDDDDAVPGDDDDDDVIDEIPGIDSSDDEDTDAAEAEGSEAAAACGCATGGGPSPALALLLLPLLVRRYTDQSRLDPGPS